MDQAAKGVISPSAALSQGFQFGDSVFEGLLVVEGRTLFEAEHLTRLYQNIGLRRLAAPPRSDVQRWLSEAIAVSGRPSARVRLFVHRGYSGWGILEESPECIVTIAVVDNMLRGSVSAGQGLRVVSATRFTKPPASCMDMRIKAGGNYYVLKRGMEEARSANADDAILCSAEGYISEATVENVFWSKGDRLYTPEVSARTNCLPGITRQKVIGLASKLGITVEEGRFLLEELDDAEEMLLTGTSAGVVPVSAYNHRDLCSAAAGSLTAALRDAYFALCLDPDGQE